MDCGVSKSSYIGRLPPLQPAPRFALLPPLRPDPSDMVVYTHTTTSNHLTNNKRQSPPTSLRANLPHHNSLQSALGVLGQGADLEERLAKVKLWEG
jgi:hypothetical protein